MSYTISIALVLGTSQTGLTLIAQLFGTDGVDYGSSISTGFVEIGRGNYLWTNSFEDGFRGGAKIYTVGDPSNILTVLAINPEELQQVAELVTITENIETTVNEIETNVSANPKEITIEVPHIATHSTTIDMAAGSTSNRNQIEIKTGVR